VRPLLAALGIVCGAGGAAAESVRLVQILPGGEPVAGFEMPCTAGRCTGVGTLLSSEGWIRVEGEARIGQAQALLMLRSVDGVVSTSGPVAIQIRDGRGARSFGLVRGWRPEAEAIVDGVWRQAEPAGIALRAAVGP
jgi:hypothetical protein